jgi:hypothetical protein
VTLCAFTTREIDSPRHLAVKEEALAQRFASAAVGGSWLQQRWVLFGAFVPGHETGVRRAVVFIRSSTRRAVGDSEPTTELRAVSVQSKEQSRYGSNRRYAYPWNP